MLQYIKYRQKLSELFRRKEPIRATYAAEILKALKQGKPHDDIKELEHHSWFEEEIMDEEISLLTTDHLIRMAGRRFVPILTHEEPEMWRQCRNIGNQYFLTDAVISKLRSSLRLEQKERNELLFPILAAITGILGAATGLVAVLLK